MFEVYEANVLGNGRGGSGVRHGLIIDEKYALDPKRRLAIAAKLGYDETIFINDLENRSVSFFSQTKEIPFAGTAALAATGVISTVTGNKPATLLSQGETIDVEMREKLVWVTAALGIMPPWNYMQMHDAPEVDSFRAAQAKDLAHTMLWAWIDEKAGMIRARTFASDWLIPEAEANGSGSMALAAQLGRPIVIRHGKGSRIFAEPASGDRARLGGSVVMNALPLTSPGP